jgi:transcriptional regulator with XRE-family HTH domain
MRPSPLRHPLAVLRQLIGLRQKELAQLLGKSTPTVQAIELGKLKLSEDLAAKIEEETGVSADWLLNGEAARPPRNRVGATYGKDDYELARAGRSTLPQGKWEFYAFVIYGQTYGDKLANIFAAADRCDPSMKNVAFFRTEQFIEEMTQKFGEAPDDYLEYRSRVKITTTEHDGTVFKVDSPIAPSVQTLHYENLSRSIREIYSAEDAARILALYVPKPSERSVKKPSKKPRSQQKAKQRSPS